MESGVQRQSGSRRRPPADLAERSLPLVDFVGPLLYRAHRDRHHPVYFNERTGRFLAPGGTLYLGTSDLASFSEAFDHEFQRLAQVLVISESVLAQSCLCPVRLVHPIRLVDLTTGPALRSLDADSGILGGPHEDAQAWARALWDHPARPDGLHYRCRSAPELSAVALFARAASALSANCVENVLRQGDRLERILDYFRCALIP